MEEKTQQVFFKSTVMKTMNGIKIKKEKNHKEKK